MDFFCCKSKFLAAILFNNLFLPLYYCKCITDTPYYHFLVFLQRNLTQHGDWCIGFLAEIETDNEM